MSLIPVTKTTLYILYLTFAPMHLDKIFGALPCELQAVPDML